MPPSATSAGDRWRQSSSVPVDLSDTGSVAVTVTGAGGILIGDLCAGDTVTVEVTYTFPFIMPFMNIFVPGNTLPLSASTAATVLAPDC